MLENMIFHLNNSLQAPTEVTDAFVAKSFKSRGFGDCEIYDLGEIFYLSSKKIIRL